MTCCPLTKAGTIIVNGTPVSCFAHAAHWISKLGFFPLTHGFVSSNNVPKYVDKLIDIHYSLPKFIRKRLPVYL